MAKSTTDPTEAMCEKARGFDGCVEGTSCTQTSFKRGKKAFFYIGTQGGRYKAMFKLEKSRGEAEERASREPDRYEVGSTAWVTARFTAEKPMPKRLWEKWLKESYALSG